MKGEQSFSSVRKFQLWSYIVSHRQLLLRSTKTTRFPTRIEILFKDVSFILLSTAFDGLSIQEIERGLIDRAIDLAHVPSDHKIFEVTSGGMKGYIAALFFFSCEDEKEYFDRSSLLVAALEP